jgi:hypothetical protein
MKKVFVLLLISCNSLIFLSSCKKESAGDNKERGPDIALPNSGFLCTIGIGQSGAKDTLTYNPWGGGPVTVYMPGYQDADDKLNITKNSNNTVTLQRSVPLISSTGSEVKYFGSQRNVSPDFSSFPQNDYLFYIYDVKSDETEFILQRDTTDILKFSLECKSHPGFFLSTAKWRNAVYPTETHLVIS